jgi:hypothetical protein
MSWLLDSAYRPIERANGIRAPPTMATRRMADPTSIVLTPL